MMMIMMMMIIIIIIIIILIIIIYTLSFKYIFVAVPGNTKFLPKGVHYIFDD